MFDSIYNNNHYPFVDDDNNSYNSHFFNNFPSHLLDDDELFMDTILPYQPPPPPAPAPAPPPLPPPQPPSLLTTTNAGQNSDETSQLPRMVKKKQEAGSGSSSRRKAGKKDRHSKIFTAHGPRDRRMRLSLQIARKFFDLQDMLGFDKASKTIEWLFNKSRAAIKDLADKSCTTNILPHVMNNCEGVGINNNNNKKKNKDKSLLLLSERKRTKEGIYKMNEKRKEARARARERTKEKLIMKKNKEVLEMKEKNPNNNSNSNSNCLEKNDVVRVDNKVHQQQLEDQMASVGIIEKFLAASSSMADFGHDDDHQDSAFSSMEFSGSRVADRSRISDGLLQELVVNCEYNQVQDPNCAFMDRTYNSSREFNY